MSKYVASFREFMAVTHFNHSHKKQKYSLETRAVLIEIFFMLKFTEWPKTPGITSKKDGFL